MIKITTESELAAYRAMLHSKILADNPGRDFSVLFGCKKATGIETVVVWHDGKGEIIWEK